MSDKDFNFEDVIKRGTINTWENGTKEYPFITLSITRVNDKFLACYVNSDKAATWAKQFDNIEDANRFLKGLL